MVVPAVGARLIAVVGVVVAGIAACSAQPSSPMSAGDPPTDAPNAGSSNAAAAGPPVAGEPPIEQATGGAAAGSQGVASGTGGQPAGQADAATGPATSGGAGMAPATGGPPAPPDAGGGTPMPDAGGEPTITCSSDSDVLSPGTTMETIEVDGVTRSYALTVPSGYDGSEPVPLVLEFHGLGLDAELMRTGISTFAAIAERENLIFAWPQGIDNAWNVGPCCTRERTVDDVAFARALVERLTGQGCIDRSRIYATGYSNGGGMSYVLACEAGDVFAAVAPAAFDLVEEYTCQPARPIPVISFRGANDPIVFPEAHESVPPTWLTSGYSLPAIHFMGPESTFELWSQLNGCAGTASSEVEGCRTYDDCTDGVEVTLCIDQLGAHDPADADRAWQFLRRFTLP